MLEIAKDSVMVDYIVYRLIYIVLIASIVAFCKWIFKRVDNTIFESIFYILLGSIVILFISPGLMMNKQFIGSTILVDFLQVMASVATLWAVKYIKLGLSDYILMHITFFIIKEYCYTTGFEKGLLILGTFSIFCILVKSRYEDIKKISLQVDVSFLSSVFVYFIYGQIYDKGLSEVYYKISKNSTLYGKGIILLLMSIVLLAVMYLIIMLIKRWLNFYFIRLKNFSEKYKEIGYYLLIIPYFIGVLLLIVDGLFMKRIWDNSQLNIWKVCVVLLFIGTQIFYIKLLITTISLKEHLSYKENEKDNLVLYNEELNKNMQDIREVKHDLKNIFLTMGEYVSRSNDSEFKEYYYEKIAPYAKNEIKMNDIYVSLQNIKNESIKSFLYYKILQCMDKKVELKLDTKLDHSVLPYLVDISTISRILGIFIDNAMEECIKQNKGTMSINISELKGNVSFTIKNSVRDIVKQHGIYIGVTDKGLGRGNGLKIVEKLVKKHSDILWNYYFNKDTYVQSITIIRNKNA